MNKQDQQHEQAAAETPTDKQSPQQAGKPTGQPAGNPPASEKGADAQRVAGTVRTAPPSPAAAAPLAPGTRIGSYLAGRLLRDVVGERLYLATAAEATSSDESDMRFLLEELPAGASKHAGAVEAVMGAGLQHPRLLVPRERVPFEGRVFLVLAGLPNSRAIPVAAGEGTRLRPIEALKAGAGLADALSYMHRNGLAHGHVAADVLLFQDERAYLAGLQHAVMLDEPNRDAQALVAEDANALARMLGALAHLSAAPAAAASDDASEPDEVLAEIVGRGATNAFTTPDEVASSAGAGLLANPQPLPANTEPAATRLRLRHSFATTVGMVRSENQDATAAVTFNLLDDAAGAHLPVGVFLVADGMGGEAHGELASRIAARVVPAELTRLYVLPLTMYPALATTEPDLPAPETSPTALAQALNDAVALANRQIRLMAEYYRQDTGSTLTALAVSGARAIIAHLGDSRAYLLRDGTMTQLTEDHTLLARLQAMDHPILSDDTMFVPRNFLYRSLGQEQSPPDLLEFTLAPGDRLMICSDGLWDEVDDATIARTLAAGNDPARCAERLVAAANAAGGHDNSTALVLFVEAVEAVQSVGPVAAPPERTEPTERAAEKAAQDVAPSASGAPSVSSASGAAPSASSALSASSASSASSEPGTSDEPGSSGDSDDSDDSAESAESPDGSEAQA